LGASDQRDAILPVQANSSGSEQAFDVPEQSAGVVVILDVFLGDEVDTRAV
jgi:hypothetical protein